MEDEQCVEAQIAYGPSSEWTEARVVIDFWVGPDGVGPVMGFDSGDFFPTASDVEMDPTEPHDTPGTAMVR